MTDTTLGQPGRRGQPALRPEAGRHQLRRRPNPSRALGATLAWPSEAAVTKDNVATSEQAISLSCSGSKPVFLGTGSNHGSTGNATVYHTDGTSSSGTFGSPNWSCQEAIAHGATLIASSIGRNRPSG